MSPIEGAGALHIATEDEIRAGRVTDVYFPRSVAVLRTIGSNPPVVAEVSASPLPGGAEWTMLAGVDEVAELLSDVEVDLHALPEGALFGRRQPVVRISGRYLAFAEMETALLGVLCQASGIATKAARCRLAARDRGLFSFGARRMHPAIGPLIDRSAYIGGCDGVATVLSARRLGLQPTGTMPHAFVLIVGDSVRAFQLFDEHAPGDVPRVCLVDTFSDEKTESLAAAEALGDHLRAVRLDTPGSRRGDMRSILEEVRWELDAHGYQQVQLFVSGGLDETSIKELVDLADGFGVGTAISNAPTVNFALDLVEIDGRPVAKRGKFAGVKQVLQCERCAVKKVCLQDRAPDACDCGGTFRALLRPVLRAGKVVSPLPSPAAAREFALAELGRLAAPS